MDHLISTENRNINDILKKLELLEIDLKDAIPLARDARENGEDINKSDRFGMTILHWAASYKNTEAIKKLLDLGVDFTLKNNDKKTFLDILGADDLDSVKDVRTYILLKQIENNNLENLKSLLNERKYDINHQDESGMTVLHHSACKNNFDAIKILIEKGINTEILDNKGNTFRKYLHIRYMEKVESLILVQAIVDGDAEKVDKLINEGIDLNSISEFGDSALMIAAKNSSIGNIIIVDELIKKGVNLNSKNFYGDTPLIFASKNENLTVLYMLIEAGADVNEKNNLGKTALMYVSNWVTMEDVNAIRELISNNADVSAKDNSGSTALMEAVKAGNREVINTLIQNNASVNEKANDGSTPLILAAIKSDKQMVKTLLENGADSLCKNNEGFNAEDYMPSIKLIKQEFVSKNKTTRTGCLSRSASSSSFTMDRRGELEFIDF